MGKSAGNVPQYEAGATRQAQASQTNVAQQTRENRPNIFTPWMQQQWTTGPDGTPVFSSGFGGGLQQGAQAATEQAGQALGQGLDPSLFARVGTGDEARQQAIESSFGQSLSRLSPMLAQRENAMQSRLANQGLSPTSQAYRAAASGFGRERNDAIQGALNSAISQGTDAGNTALMGNIAASQANLGSAMAQRRAPIQDLGILQGLLQAPSFNQAGLAETPQFLQALMAQGNYRLQDANMQNQAWGSALGGLFGAAGGLGGAAIMASDERLKTHIVRYRGVELLPGIPLATWEWLNSDSVRVAGMLPGGRGVGVIAQDVEKVRPDLVSVGEDGFKRVNYQPILWGE